MSLYWTFIGPIFPETNIPCFTIIPYSRHHYLAASVFVSNYFQERNTLRVKLEPKYLMSTLRTENCNYFYQTRYCTSFSNTKSNIPLVLCCSLFFYFYNKNIKKPSVMFCYLDMYRIFWTIRLIPPNLGGKWGCVL